MPITFTDSTPIRAHWETLMTPITADHPSGEYLVYEGTYDAIKAARRQDDPNLPLGEWQRELKTAEWTEARRLCLGALSTRSKDLQLAVWLMEALLDKHGFSAVSDGLRLIHGLSEQFWDSLWPELETDDIELRLSPLIWLNEKLITPLVLLPITAPSEEDFGYLTYADYQKALQTPEQAQHQLKTSKAKFMQSMNATPTVFYQGLAETLQDCLDNLQALNALLDENCGRAAPSFTKLRDTLKNVQQSIQSFLKERIGEVDMSISSAHDTAEDVAMNTDETATATPSGGTAIRSRSEAYRRLSEAADYLQRTEPHSPTPFLVKRAVSWGNLPLQELLLELVNDQSDLQAIYALLGMATPDDDEHGY